MMHDAAVLRSLHHRNIQTRVGDEKQRERAKIINFPLLTIKRTRKNYNTVYTCYEHRRIQRKRSQEMKLKYLDTLP